MPLYQFACQACGQPFERKLRMSQSGDTQRCPHCNSNETRKRLGAIAVNGTARTPNIATAGRPPRSPFS